MATRTSTPLAFDTGGSVRQSVALVAALMLAMLLAPVAAGAAGTLVSIVDPSSGAKAHVTDGRLQVGDGTGPLTVNGNVNVGNLPNPQPIAGTVNVVHTAGAPIAVAGTVDVENTAGAPIDVRGTVLSHQGIQPDPWDTFAAGAGTSTLTLFDAPSGNVDLGVTSLTLTNTGDTIDTVTIEVSGNCQAGQGGHLTEVSVPPQQTMHLEYPQPLLAHFASGSACLLAEINGNGSTKITGVGFSQ
jgi:hypothetical protein